MNVKIIFFLLIALFGIVVGFYSQITSTPIQIDQPKNNSIHPIKTKDHPDKPEAVNQTPMYMSVEELDGHGVRIPVFQEGVRLSELRASRITYKKGGPIELTDPIVYEYAEDGKTIVSKMEADHGRIDINLETQELEHLQMWGNAKMVKVITEEMTEEK
jgi:hypothetical protein